MISSDGYKIDIKHSSANIMTLLLFPRYLFTTYEIQLNFLFLSPHLKNGKIDWDFYKICVCMSVNQGN